MPEAPFTADDFEPDQKLECPSCQAPLSAWPKRQTKCRSCGEFFFAKRRPQTRKRVICTEEQRWAIEADWTREGESKRLDQLRADTADAQASMGSADPAEAARGYFNMARVVRDAGGDWRSLQRKAFIFQAIGYGQTECATAVRIQAHDQCCDHAKKLHDTVVSLRDAKAGKLPLPHASCEWCGCYIEIVFDFELDPARAKAAKIAPEDMPLVMALTERILTGTPPSEEEIAGVVQDHLKKRAMHKPSLWDRLFFHRKQKRDG